MYRINFFNLQSKKSYKTSILISFLNNFFNQGKVGFEEGLES